MHAIWCIDLSQPSEAFWRATIPEFKSLYRAWEERENREYRRAGTIAAQVLNATRTKKSDKLYQPWDLFPHLKPKPKRRSPEVLKRMFLAKLAPERVKPE
jgi:hypothetical protein